MASNEDQITCQICHTQCHVMKKHLETQHPDVSIEEYQKRFPLAPVLSERAQAALKQRAAAPSPVTDARAKQGNKAATKRPLHELFGFGEIAAAKSNRGTPIPITVLGYESPDDPAARLVPEQDRSYIFNPDLVKSACLAIEANMPMYLYGHAGVGKSTLVEQICHHTNRGYVRVQHTGGMEEANVEGQWVVNKEGTMEFQLGPLPEAMEQGLVYCADEYDFAPPQVASLYQAVLEGKPLFIKSANRKIYPHPNFRFFATGNTNGAGDESGLYNGTMVQNAANYERFAIMCRVPYMEPRSEEALLIAKAGLLDKDAKKLVEFATSMREAFDRKDVSLPISPRSLINAARIGAMRGNWRTGLEQAYIARLTPLSQEVANQIAQRMFGA